MVEHAFNHLTVFSVSIVPIQIELAALQFLIYLFSSNTFQRLLLNQKCRLFKFFLRKQSWSSTTLNKKLLRTWLLTMSISWLEYLLAVWLWINNLFNSVIYFFVCKNEKDNSTIIMFTWRINVLYLLCA